MQLSTDQVAQTIDLPTDKHVELRDCTTVNGISVCLAFVGDHSENGLSVDQIHEIQVYEPTGAIINTHELK